MFAIDAHAHGDGPETVVDCLTQEFQWSRSMMNVLLRVNRRYWRRLRPAAKVRLGFCQLWYPMFALLMLASIVVPLVAIASRTPAMRVSLGSFYLHYLPATLVLLGVVLWLRSMKWLRPVDARVLSWEIALFQLVRWPWVLLGCAQSAAGWLTRREFDFKVTPKGRSGPRPLPLRVILPYLLIALVSAGPALLGLHGGPAHGYLILALVNSALYLTAATAIVVLHVAEHTPGLRRPVLRRSVGVLGMTGATAAAVLLAISIPLSRLPGIPIGARPAIGLWSVLAGFEVPAAAVADAAGGPASIGVTTQGLADNPTIPWAAGVLAQVGAFERATRVRASIVMWYADWAHSQPSLTQLQSVRRRGAIPEISWEPWDALGPSRQPRFTLASIIAGRHDAYIRSWALGLRSYGHPVLLRFAGEMNGYWYPWGKAANGNRPGQFVRAWRRVHDLFRRVGASNVRWVWSPVARATMPLDTELYPGAAYVDVVGLSGFNAGTALPHTWGGWRSFATIFGPSVATLGRLAPDKPIQISEVGSVTAGGSETAWVRAMFAYLRLHPQIRSLIWFNLRKQADWRLTSSRSASAAFGSAYRQLSTAD